MKKVLLLLLMVTGSFYAQVQVNQPGSIVFCDSDNDGFETLDLTVTVPEILGGLSPSDYSVDFYVSMTGAELEDSDSLILTPSVYMMSTGSQTIYIRVEELADGDNFALATLQVTTSALPVFSINDITICEGEVAFLDSGLNGGSYLFQWFLGGSAIPGATAGSFSATSEGDYKLIVTDIVTGCEFEDSAVVTVNPSAVAILSGSSTVEIGETAVVIITGTPNATVTYNIDSGSGSGVQQVVALDNSGIITLALSSFTAYATICITEVSLGLCTTTFPSCFTVVINSTDSINIPDVNFKAKLVSASTSSFNVIARNASGNPIVIDINSNGEIEESEALLVYSLSVRNSGIADLTGLAYFTNLKRLEVDFNPLTSLSTAGLVHLEHLAGYNCSVATANLNDSVNLKTLMLNNNQLTTLNISNLVNLQYLTVGSNQLASLDVSGMTSLVNLDCANNLLSELNINSLTNLTGLNCANNLLTNLSIDNLVNLTGLSFGNSGLNPIEVNNLVNLTSLSFYGGFQTTMDISNLVNLNILTFSTTNLTAIDASNNPNVGEFMVSENPDLTYLNAKDGTPDSFISVTSCPNLIAICTNEEDVEQLYASIIMQGNANPNLSVTSYCDFTPGGDYNTITGSIIYDFDNDGCDDNDAQPFIKISINDGTEEGSSFADELGNYIFYTQEGNFTITPQLENPSHFTVSPVNATVNFLTNNNSVSTNNFCITANGVQPNAEIVVAPITPARPGFDAEYRIVYKNTGNQVLSGQVYFYFNDAVLDLVSTNVPTSAEATGLLTWNYTDLYPFESRSINVVLNVNGPMETPAVNNGDELIFNVGTNPINGNEIVFSYHQTVVGSFDPNDIICLQGDNESPSEIGNYLHYIVNFENTGTAPAENVVVKVDIDATKYDVPSLQLLNGSHAVEARVHNNVAEFIFNNIGLETNGHGNILLKIKSKETLNAGDTVTKKANIFFDYNFPILTNDANTTFQVLSVEEHLRDNSIAVYPNPSHNVVNIEAGSVINSVQVYDIQGRLLMTHLAIDTKTKIDISDKANGIYFFKIYSNNGIKLEKIIKK